MKFVRAEIYGFGKWVDATFDFTNGLLASFYGENEAGKSTLQQFILYMLFGLPPRKRNFYQPKNSNRVGGTLTVIDEQIGQYTIERVGDHVTCLLANGKTYDELWLDEQLKGMSREVYTSIYAFSANDLTDIRKMKRNQLSDVLFSVGLTGATAIYDVEKKLDNKLAGLFKKAGRNPVINKQIKLVQEKHQQLQIYKENEAKYRDQKALQEQLEKSIVKEKTTLTELQAELYQNEKVQHMIPMILDYQTSKRSLQTYPTDIPFPEDGIDRFQALKNNMIPLKSEWEIFQKNIEQYIEKRTMLKKEIYAPSIYKVAQSIVAQKQEDENNKLQLIEKEKMLDKMNNTIKDQLVPLNLEEKEVQETVLPFHIEANWQEIRDLNIQLQQESEHLAEEIQYLSVELNKIKEEKNEISSFLLPEQEVTEYQIKINQYDYYQTTNHTEMNQKQRVEDWKQRQSRLASGTLLGTSIIGIASVLAGFFMDNYMWFGLAIVIVLVGFLQVSFIKQTIREAKNDTGRQASPQPISQAERVHLESKLNLHHQYLADVRTLENEEKRLELQKIQWEEKKRMFDQKESQWEDRLKTEQYQYPFLKQVEPDHWLDLLNKVKEIKHLLRDKQELIEEINILKEARSLLEEKMRHFATDIEWEEASITMKDIEKLLDKEKQIHQSLEQYERLLEETEEKQQEVEMKMASYEKEILGLLSIARVKDEEEYFKNAREIEDKAKLMNRVNDLEQQLTPLRKSGQSFHHFLEGINQEEIDRKVTSLKEEINDCQTTISDLNKQLAAVEMMIKQMEKSENNSKAAFTYQMEKDKLNKLAEEWAISQIAQTALMKAKDSYQKKHLTEVIRLTSEFFCTLTNGKYEKVHAPTGSKLFQVEANNYIRYTVDELSQGTIDQLYVSLRLAISKVMSDKYVIPLMIDDAFVNFDDQRTDQIIKIIKAFAKEQQILFFTCKQEIARKLEAEYIRSDLKV
ncbi:AAA family ATPase [Pseudogracilibacillus sp. SE30717A]|uniref:ATP-binding protein n=1 Tax=Pseudogracilibacillus sp. SE30717A TaxID=3098293 RepID=UPI00300DF95D